MDMCLPPNSDIYGVFICSEPIFPSPTSYILWKFVIYAFIEAVGSCVQPLYLQPNVYYIYWSLGTSRQKADMIFALDVPNAYWGMRKKTKMK